MFKHILENTLNKISHQNIPCFIAGDFNIDLIKWNSNSGISEYLDCLLINNFMPTLVLPTRLTSKSNTFIDHIYFYEGKHKDTVRRRRRKKKPYLPSKIAQYKDIRRNTVEGCQRRLTPINAGHPLQLKIKSGNIISDISDHLPNYMLLFQENCNPRIDRPMVRVFSKKCIDSFVNKLESVNWNTVLH